MSEFRQPSVQTPITAVVVARLKSLQQNCPYLTEFERETVRMAVDHLCAARELCVVEYTAREWRARMDADEYERMLRARLRDRLFGALARAAMEEPAYFYGTEARDQAGDYVHTRHLLLLPLHNLPVKP